MENIDLGKSANQIWRESGSTLSFKNWLQREKDKGRFLPNKQLIEFSSVEGESEFNENQEIIKQTLKANKSNNIPNKVGLDKIVITISIGLILGGIAYKIYKSKSK
jgi:hypothetical protein